MKTKKTIVAYIRVTFSFINFVISLGAVASAMFGRLDHARCLGILGDVWYSMRLVSRNCRVIFPTEFRRMFD